MAEITLVGVKYTTIDDKTAIASISEKRGTFIILKKVKIDGKEYTVTKVGHLDINYGRITVSIPDSVTSIGNMSDCSNITIPDSVTSIGDMVRCSNMKINFHNGIKSLNKISGLNGITIPDSVTSIGDMEHCSNITIPDHITSIRGVRYCYNITIPDSITSISRIHCGTLIIPASVATINEISGENGSLMLMMESTTPPTLAKAIYLTKDDTLTVPVGAAEAYKKHPVWGKFKNISERNISASTNTKKAKPKPAEKVEEKKKGFFARLFGL